MHDGLRAYGRTLRLLAAVAPWQSAALLGTVLCGAALPVGNYAAVLHLVNALTASVGRAGWWAPVAPWLGLLVGLRLAGAALEALAQPLTVDLQERVEIWLNGGILARVGSADLAALQAAPYQDALARASGVSGLDLINILHDLGQSARLVLGGLALGAVLWRYGAAVPVLPLLGGIATWLRRDRFAADVYEWDRSQTRQRRQRDGLATLLTERAAAQEVRLYQAAADWVARWQALWLDLERGRAPRERRRGAIGASLAVLRAALYGGALLLLLLRILHGGMSVGAYVAGAAALVEVEGMWNWAANHASYLAGAMRQLRGDLYAFLDEAPRGPAARRAEQPLPSAAGGLELDGVGFTYPGQERPALQGLTLRLAPGERVGIVGPNGAGKTTLARLLLGLYAPTEGEIRAGGIPLSAQTRPDWWRQCSAVFQDFTRYHLTARENVGFGDLARPDRVPAAAEAGDAAAVIAELPDGLETTLGATFSGRDLSGGQWQRLATARGFMREAGLIVLDEPAAALDPLAELGVYARFGALTRGRTAVLISHRLASARQCDRILVLEAGRVVEDGTHEALLALGGLYAKLFQAQAQWYADRPGPPDAVR